MILDFFMVILRASWYQNVMIISFCVFFPHLLSYKHFQLLLSFSNAKKNFIGLQIVKLIKSNLCSYLYNDIDCGRF